MTEEQEAHLKQILRDYIKEYATIYRNGAKEYGTVMSTLPALDMVREAKQEAQDSYAYNHTAESQLLRAKSRLTALKEQLQEHIPDQLFDADENTEPLNKWGLEPGRYHYTIGELEELYDPIRRVEAIQRILFGDTNG